MASWVALASIGLLVFVAGSSAVSLREDSLPEVLHHEEPVVQLNEGLVRGYKTRTVYGFPYFIFQGIPYAEPPEGPLRFKAPEPKAPWNGILNATTEGSWCPQVDEGLYVGEEDCLYLNVYTPQLPRVDDPWPREPLKVMVWIHGGGFVGGDGGKKRFGPDFLVQRSVVIVSFNYRLAALGYLSLENEQAPGNQGLKDQTLVLQWVRRNIHAFNGDPDDVTIFGESSGGAAVHFHLLSRLSAGLFSRAIAFSGTALSPWAFSDSPRQRALRLASALGLDEGATDQQALHFLSQQATRVLVEQASAALSPEENLRFMIWPFVPSVEPDLPGALMTENPTVLVAEGRHIKVPYLTGVSSAEANVLVSVADNGALATNVTIAIFDQNFEAVVGSNLRLNESERYEAAQTIRHFYFGDEPITTASNISTTNMFSDLFFEEGTDVVVRKLAEDPSNPVYYYRFSFKGPLSATPDVPGVSHGEILPYIFLTASADLDLNPASEESKVRNRLVDMLTNFARHGDPTPHETPLLTTKWEPSGVESAYFLDIGAELTLERDLDKERMELWHSLLPPTA